MGDQSDSGEWGWCAEHVSWLRLTIIGLDGETIASRRGDWLTDVQKTK